MPTAQHEALHRIFQDDPSLLFRTFERLLDIPFPADCSVSVVDTDLTEMNPIERRADTVLRLKTQTDDHLIVIESQLSDRAEKASSWAYYVSYLHAKYRCPVTLFVVCQDDATARWARVPMKIGLDSRPSLVLLPLVLGPDNVPMVTDVSEAAADLGLTVFSALTHGRSRRVTDILETLAAALDTIDIDTAKHFAELTEVGLGDTQARHLWRAMMSTKTYRFQSEYAEMLRAEAKVEEAIHVLLRLLDRRGVAVSEAAREKITACTDTGLIEDWIDRAVTATTADELFG
jgi:hypothetical protein